MEDHEHATALGKILHKQAGPYLFVGAGMSIRYAGLPGWKDLLEVFAKYTKYPIDYYVGAADGDLSLAATSIAHKFWQIWWDSSEFESSRQSYNYPIEKKSTPLKIEIANHLQKLLKEHTIPEKLQEEYEAFSQVEIDAIITTNFDNLLSQLFPQYRVFVGQDQLLFENPQGVAEIYHIHGSTKSPESLVLTNSDYADFNDRNPYLAAKLITIFAEHPVIFLGYSMSDPNIMQILRAVVHGFHSENADKLRQKIIFVDWKPNSQPSIQESVIQIDGTSIPVTRIETDSYLWIYKVLANRKRALPAWLLRSLKEQVYELVNTDDPRRQLMYVKDIPETPNDQEFDIANIDVVFGVGARILKKGLIALSRWDLVDDVLDNPTLPFDSAEILKTVIPTLGKTTYVPIFKHLSSTGLIHDLRSGDYSKVTPCISDRFKSYVNTFETSSANNPTHSMDELLRLHDEKWLAHHALELPHYTRDIEGLRNFLIRNRDWRDKSWFSTQYGKLAIVYDWMRFSEL